MRVLIVYAHPEPASFNGALMRAAVETLTGAGHEVVVSDLYAMGFDPVSDRRNFRTVADPVRLHLQAEEAHAARHDGFALELQAEMDKIDACDLLIFQFPLWWLGLPAILKGWVDRVLACGRAYGGGRFFDSGVFLGKRAICCLTVGGSREVYSDRGHYGDIEPILYPIHRGIFEFTGFEVLAPFVTYGPNRMTAGDRAATLEQYRARLLDAARHMAASLRAIPPAGS